MGDGFANGVIRLENEPRAVFYAGQEISGSVLFELNQPLRFSVLTLTFLGEANVLWTEDQKEEYNGVVRHRLVKYIGYEEYFKYTEFLAGGQGVSKLPAGSRAFPFTYRIPLTSPSSFMGEKGSVRYSITACLVGSDHMATKEELFKEFQVIAPLDLNFGPPDAKRPIEMEFEEVYGCDCICSPEPMTIRVRLPVTGYCPGQVMPVSVHIENNSSAEINKIIFQLLSKERYRSKQPIAEYIPEEKVLTTYNSGAVLGKSRRNFTCDITVPDMIPPNLENCSIIDMGYFFRIRIKMSGCNSDLKDDSDIYLGMVPLFETTEGDYVHPMAYRLPIVALTDLNKGYERTEAVNPEFVEPTNTPYSPSNNNYNKNALHLPQNTPYPSKNSPNSYPKAPYPSENTPFPSQKPPYPSQNPPYPSENNPLQSKNSPYPSENTDFQSKNKPYPSENTPLQSKISPYISPKVPYPSENTPFPPQKSPYPSHNSPYPTENTRLQSKNLSYTSPKAPNSSENTPLQSKNAPYPSENTTFPSQNSPYPSPKAPYPVSVNSPHSANKPFTDMTSYPSENDQCPAENPSYTGKTPPYPIENKTDNLTAEVKPNPLDDYEIGFRTTENVPSSRPYNDELLVSPPYPVVDTMPGTSLPYPVTNNMPGPPLPAVEMDLRIYLPPISPCLEPSAPPPSS